MSYNNPNIPVIEIPVGIDRVLQDIQTSLADELPWLEKSFGRAMTFYSKDAGGRSNKYPKCPTGDGDYINVLPNDNFNSQSFITTKGPEKYNDYNPPSKAVHKQRDVSVIFWYDLRKVYAGLNYNYSEVLKKEVETVFSHIPEIVAINNYYDETDDVFSGWTVNQTDTQYLMWPFAGMKFDLTIKYTDSLCS